MRRNQISHDLLEDTSQEIRDNMKRFSEVILELSPILDSMDIPETRKEDLGWLNRNLGIRNSNHPEYEKAMSLIKELRKLNKNNK